MKFTNGMWLAKEDCQIYFPKELFSADCCADSITVFAPFTKIEHRGNTTDGGLLTITLRSPANNVISITIQNHIGSRQKEAQFSLAGDLQGADSSHVHTEETATHYILFSGKTEARINKTGQWGISYFYDGKYLTSTSGKSMAYIIDPDKKVFVRERLELSPGENVYGLGERFSSFIKNGQSIDIWNEDGGTDSEQAYKSIPFYITNKGYGVFVNTTDRVSFEVASENATKAQFSVAGEKLEYFVFGGDTVKDVISTYTDLTGKPSLPPAWTFGLWLSTSFTTEYNEETVMHFIEGMIERGIPLSAFHFDCYWMKDFEWTSFHWNESRFPNPENMIKRIHSKGVRVCVWINPYISQKSPLFKEGMGNNYFVNTGSGDVWQWDRWQAGMALVDFTNPAAKAWYQKYLESLIDMGVDAFKTDFGERIPVADIFFGNKAEKEGISYFDGSSAESMHNYYTYIYNQSVFEVLEKKLGKGNACLFARSATVGSQKFPVHWGGDCLSNYASMAESLRGGLSLSLCGFGFWSHDIGGFEAGCTPDIYKRWSQFGLLSSHSRYHGNQEYKVPWLYDEEAVEVSKRFTKLKLSLMPYLFAAAVQACTEGIPMMRPMFLEFPSDRTCEYLDQQYMLGSSLLSAPIFNSDGLASYYVPSGIWTNIITGFQVAGPGWVQEKHDYFSFPLLARENSVIVTGVDSDTAEYDYAESARISVYNLQDGAHICESVHDLSGVIKAHVQIERTGETITITTDGFTGETSIFLSNIMSVKSSPAVKIKETERGVILHIKEGKTTINL